MTAPHRNPAPPRAPGAPRETVRVYIADDQPIYLDGLVGAIGAVPLLELVGIGNGTSDVAEDIRTLRPDVALIALRMPAAGALETLQALKCSEVPTRVVLLSAHVDAELVFSAAAAGAAGYLLKDADRHLVVDALLAAARGETRLAPGAQAALVQAVRMRCTPGEGVLSARERDVLPLMADGLTTAEIGRRLHLSAATIKTHLRGIYGKLGVCDRGAAVAEAMRRGILR